jgi:hypothetical protein
MGLKQGAIEKTHGERIGNQLTGTNEKTQKSFCPPLKNP